MNQHASCTMAKMAHDIKNLLQVAGLHTEVLLDCCKCPNRGDVVTVHKLVTQAGVLSKQLVSLGVREVSTTSNPDTLVGDILSGFTLLLKNIEVTVNLGAGKTCCIPMASSDLARVVSNLVVNAREALDGKGHLLIETRQSPESYEILVADNGPGIEPELLDHIFKPRFTTKSDGNGLGLATVRELVEEAGGSISTQTNLGHGTTFIVSLPCSQQAS